MGWAYATEEELANWTIEALPDQGSLEINKISPTGNKTLKNEDPDQPSKPDEDASTEAEALADIERWIDREKPKFEAPTKDLENINLEEGIEGREVRIGKQVPPDLRIKLIKLLKEYADIFAWSYQDMPDLDLEIVEHKLPLLLGSTPIRQQLQRMKPEVALKIKEEVEKQWNVGFLEVANYPQWVADIVPVPKKVGKVRMCMDYRDLNRASPKDNFPLPHIDVLVDNTAQHAFFSFMDGFSGYNQIMMLPEDREKMMFITLWGTFCYKVIPFGLKNARATYQRAMVTLFHDMMHKEIEVYMDDMIAKLNTLEQHIEDLRKLFARLRKYKLRLNPAKCTFGIKTGKLLSFVVNENNIEVDPDKVKTIREMPIPKTELEVRGFLGRVNFIARFISQLTATCNPIFKLLRKKQKMKWDTECKEAFDKIKRYLENPSVLVPAAPGRPLILYLTVLGTGTNLLRPKLFGVRPLLVLTPHRPKTLDWAETTKSSLKTESIQTSDWAEIVRVFSRTESIQAITTSRDQVSQAKKERKGATRLKETDDRTEKTRRELQVQIEEQAKIQATQKEKLSSSEFQHRMTFNPWLALHVLGSLSVSRGTRTKHLASIITPMTKSRLALL
ncbi:hypothetical protein CR513_30710, partial [Mucuna pruriens]